jgi:hypothetical protein
MRSFNGNPPRSMFNQDFEIFFRPYLNYNLISLKIRYLEDIVFPEYNPKSDFIMGPLGAFKVKNPVKSVCVPYSFVLLAQVRALYLSYISNVAYLDLNLSSSVVSCIKNLQMIKTAAVMPSGIWQIPWDIGIVIKFAQCQSRTAIILMRTSPIISRNSKNLHGKYPKTNERRRGIFHFALYRLQEQARAPKKDTPGEYFVKCWRKGSRIRGPRLQLKRWIARMDTK